MNNLYVNRSVAPHYQRRSSGEQTKDVQAEDKSWFANANKESASAENMRVRYTVAQNKKRLRLKQTQQQEISKEKLVANRNASERSERLSQIKPPRLNLKPISNNRILDPAQVKFKHGEEETHKLHEAIRLEQLLSKECSEQLTKIKEKFSGQQGQGGQGQGQGGHQAKQEELEKLINDPKLFAFEKAIMLDELRPLVDNDPVLRDLVAQTLGDSNELNHVRDVYRNISANLQKQLGDKDKVAILFKEFSEAEEVYKTFDKNSLLNYLNKFEKNANAVYILRKLRENLFVQSRSPQLYSEISSAYIALSMFKNIQTNISVALIANRVKENKHSATPKKSTAMPNISYGDPYARANREMEGIVHKVGEQRRKAVAAAPRRLEEKLAS